MRSTRFSTRRSTLRSFAALAAMALGATFGGNAQAAGYPERPIELIVPWGPGGGADQLARLVSKLMEPMLGQGIPVVNVPGGTGATGMAKLLAAPADGYSMAIYIADSHALLAGKSPRWTMNDITPVAVMIKGPSFIFVKQDSPFKTWDDFAKEAKANPNKLKVATLGFGSVDDFSLTVLDRGGVKVVQVPFSKPSERYVSILGGHADALYEQAGDVAQFLNSKQMRPILLFGEKRLPAFKDVPASYELGYKVALPQFRSIVVRAGTPPDVVKKLSDALAKVYESPEYKKFLEEQFADPNSFEDASKAPAFVNEQLNDMKKTIATNCSVMFATCCFEFRSSPRKRGSSAISTAALLPWVPAFAGTSGVEVMDKALFRSVLPYAVGLAIAVALYLYVGTIVYSPRPGQLGPETWPRLAILLMGGSCLFELSRRLIVGNRDATGFLEAFDREPDTEEKQPVYPRLLIGGIVLMAIYAVLVPVLGFIIGTFLFLAAFMYVGGYRDHAAIWGTTTVVTIFCGILFLRVAYVSLPRGVPPFDRATDVFFAIPSLW